MINWLAYRDSDGEITYYQQGSQQELRAASDGTLTRVPALDYVSSSDLMTDQTPVSSTVQSELDDKYDVSNPSNYIDSAGAPVQPADLAPFETTAELDNRDLANRSRTNHTGTQLANTISDFAAAVQSSESITSLSLNANSLEFTNEAGVTSSIDLSIYLDDTNLARIVSGTLDSMTGIATFTRDDSTTFTLDLSSLNDQAAIGAAITVHEAATDPHPQYTTTAEASSAAPVQSVNGQIGIVVLDKSDVGLSNVDNTSDLAKPISTATQNALDNKYDASNPNGYETPAQLNIRDTNNRNRANHTGTQTASTISDFDTEVSNNTDVAANTAKVSADGSIDTHSDVDTSTEAPQLGDTLSWDGTNWVPTRTFVGSLANPVRSMQIASINNLTGRFFVDFGSGAFEASFLDGEMLIAQYHHGAGTNPSLNIVTASGDLPIYDTSALGTDLSADSTRFSHAGNAKINLVPDSDSNLQLHWQGQTSGHSRIIDFNSNAGFGLTYARTGVGSFSGIQANFSANAGHTANIPASSNGFFLDQGNLALTNFPFFRAAQFHWGVRGLDNRWEVDDFAGSAEDTIHRVWLKYTL